MRTLRLFWTFARVGALNELQYRANFAIQIVESAISLATGLVVLALVFNQVEDLDGWSHAELLAVMGVFTLMGGIIGTFIQPNMERLIGDVRQGTLDYVLTKPDDAQVLVSVREIRIWHLVDVVLGIVILVIAGREIPGTLGAQGTLAFLAALALGATMIYCFWMILTVAAFWIVRMDEIVDLFSGVYQAGRWPISIYPDWLRVGLTFLVPIAFAVTVPAEAFTGRLSPQTLAIAAAFALGMLVVTRVLWRRGIRRYAGASA
jgi:ABC-2 type transport system permease protein